MSILLHLGAFILLNLFAQGGFTRQRIVGGKESVPYSHPYMVFITNPFSAETCDGFLVTKNFVLTAAHCSQQVMVFLGIHNKSELSLENGIFVDAIPHPDFNNKTFKNDIMLLKLKETAKLNSRIATIALPNSENKPFKHNCLVMGWGSQTFNKIHPHTSKVLKEANITAFSCGDMICSEGCTGPSFGDSGGPLVCGDVAHGIVSHTYKICNNYRARYTPISHYLSWIYSVIKTTYK